MQNMVDMCQASVARLDLIQYVSPFDASYLAS